MSKSGKGADPIPHAGRTFLKAAAQAAYATESVSIGEALQGSCPSAQQLEAPYAGQNNSSRLQHKLHMPKTKAETSEAGQGTWPSAAADSLAEQLLTTNTQPQPNNTSWSDGPQNRSSDRKCHQFSAVQ